MAATEELFETISDNNPDLLLALLKDPSTNIDVNQRDKSHGLQTLLMRSCHLHVTAPQRAAILNAVLELQPDVNIQDGGGRSCLCHACISERLEVLDVLASCQDTDPNLVDSDGNTALIYAVRSRNPNVVSQMIDLFANKGLTVNHVNTKGQSALSEAKKQHDSIICKLLLEKGKADISLMEGSSKAPPLYSNVRPCTPRNRDIPIGTHRQTPSRMYSDNICHSEPDLLHPKGAKDPLLTHPLLENLRARSINASCNSLPELTEEENNPDDEILAPLNNHLTRHKRKNSLSMPDLREGAPVVPIPQRETSNLMPSRLARHPSEHTIREEEGNYPESMGSSPKSRMNKSSLPDLRESDMVSQKTYADSSSESSYNDDENVYALNVENLTQSMSTGLCNPTPTQKTAVPGMPHMGLRWHFQRSTETLAHTKKNQKKGRLNELKNTMCVRGEAIPSLLPRPLSRAKLHCGIPLSSRPK
ncbi:hypothetical protein CAPTEDRAFT_218738 [Capitella teleta]|uniref:SOCS box domain-containing protein n=1 Tax=Capitella teleta TaxID=283909 RepID=X2ANQ5_CAPTE|nr:hypothetical protein CAPTEDRAFT_218738 [Capitella teleta]|eukprot:ELT90110.1 hypothetical protein CAPTEDRAFT_218738 [Capitella teleta]